MHDCPRCLLLNLTNVHNYNYGHTITYQQLLPVPRVFSKPIKANEMLNISIISLKNIYSINNPQYYGSTVAHCFQMSYKRPQNPWTFQKPEKYKRQSRFIDTPQKTFEPNRHTSTQSPICGMSCVIALFFPPSNFDLYGVPTMFTRPIARHTHGDTCDWKPSSASWLCTPWSLWSWSNCWWLRSTTKSDQWCLLRKLKLYTDRPTEPDHAEAAEGRKIQRIMIWMRVLVVDRSALRTLLLFMLCGHT